jgi:hypothetical protein
MTEIRAMSPALTTLWPEWLRRAEASQYLRIVHGVIAVCRSLFTGFPELVKAAKAGGFDRAVWTAAEQAVGVRDFDGTVAAIAAHTDAYATLLADVSDADFRAEVDGFDGTKTSRGALIVNLVLCGCAAYRTQLFLYLKACGREELGTMNLWAGVHAPAAV